MPRNLTYGGISNLPTRKCIKRCLLLLPSSLLCGEIEDDLGGYIVKRQSELVSHEATALSREPLLISRESQHACESLLEVTCRVLKGEEKRCWVFGVHIIGKA